jgi:hypothetical protein
MAVTAAKFVIPSLLAGDGLHSLFSHRSRGCRKANTGGPAIVAVCQNVPSMARVAAGAFGFFTLIQIFDGPDR